jgi:protein phosphatase
MKRLDLKIAASSDLGRRRPQNEDSHALWVPDDPAERERRGVLLVVADGMGGTAAGEVASRLTVETVVGVVSESSGDDVLADLRKGIEEANRLVHERSRLDPELDGMGTTCTAVVIRGDVAWFGHVGDSRAYLVRGAEIRQLTRDHSLVAHLVERRELTREQARRDPRRNVVTRSIGASQDVEVDVFQSDIRLQSGDRVVVCSDGLHGVLTDAELADIVATEDHANVCAQLIAEANDRGGPDNITVVVARLEESNAGGASGAPGKLDGAHARNPAGRPVVRPFLFVLFAVTLLLASVYWWLSRQAASL